MKITYLGHSCFKLELDGASLIIDPYKNGKVPGLADLNEQANVVLCSHDHDDHNASGLINLVELEDNPFDVSFIRTYHDDAHGSKRGITKVHTIKAGGYRVIHMGDIGCDLTPAQKKELFNPDVLMIPVGGFYTIDAKQAIQYVKDLKPKMVIPMHYRFDNVGFDEIATLDEFLDGFDKDNVYFTGNDYELDDISASFVAVMKPEYAI